MPTGLFECYSFATRRSVIFGGIAAAISVGLSACAAYPDAGLISAGTDQLEVARRGKGAPAVVLIHGLGDDMKTWDAVLKPLSAVSEVIAFNRPGYGKSSWSGAPRDAITISNEIEAMLDQAKLNGPVILVGHSLGGIYAQVFARRFPSRVAGLVLVDTTVPGQAELIRTTMPAQSTLLPALMLQEPSHVRQEFNEAEPAEKAVLSLPVYRSGPVVFLAAASGDPLSSSAYVEARREAMRSLAASYAAEFRVIDCGHFIQRERPEAVVNGVSSVLATVRRGGKPPTR